MGGGTRSGVTGKPSESRRGDIEALHPPLYVGDHIGDLRPPVGRGAALETNRTLELADALARTGEIELGTEGDLEKSVDDLGIAEGHALDGATVRGRLALLRRCRN